MAAGLETSIESASVDQSAPKNEVSGVKIADNESVNNNIDNNINNNNNGSVVESKKGSDSESKSENKMKEFADMLSSLKLNPMAKEFFPSSYSPMDRNRDQSELAVNYLVQQPAYFESYPGNGIEGYPNNRRV